MISDDVKSCKALVIVGNSLKVAMLSIFGNDQHVLAWWSQYKICGNFCSLISLAKSLCSNSAIAAFIFWIEPWSQTSVIFWYLPAPVTNNWKLSCSPKHDHKTDFILGKIIERFLLYEPLRSKPITYLLLDVSDVKLKKSPGTIPIWK